MTLGIAERVMFPGYLENLPPAYLTFDIFLLSSRREGLPNSVLEAMAMGIPVVTTDVAGTKELVVEGETGFILPQGDVDGLAKAVLALADSDQLRLRMGFAGRKRVEREFSFNHRLRRVEALYEQILGVCSYSASPSESGYLDREYSR
jgi:glycosyltransferase involved in cell wall biosynthesis